MTVCHINLDDEKVKEHIGFHYLLTEIQLYTLILLELNILLKKYLTIRYKSINISIYLEYKMMILLCVDFTLLVS